MSLEEFIRDNQFGENDILKSVMKIYVHTSVSQKFCNSFVPASLQRIYHVTKAI